MRGAISSMNFIMFARHKHGHLARATRTHTTKKLSITEKENIPNLTFNVPMYVQNPTFNVSDFVSFNLNKYRVILIKLFTMKPYVFLLTSSFLLLNFFASGQSPASDQQKNNQKPNIIIIMAD